MKLKKLGAYIAAFILMLNSVSAPAIFALADENAETGNTGEVVQSTEAPKPVEEKKPAETTQTTTVEETKESEKPATSEETKESEKPATSEETKESEKPATSEETKGSEKPATSEETKESEKPATSEETKTPEENKTPEETTTPEESKTPEETTTPEESNTPEETVTPEESKTPEETTTPEESKTPEETTTPEESNAPEETVTPEESNTPEETVTPEESNTPEETVTPEESNTPEETTNPEGTPEQTEPTEPVETTEPEEPTVRLSLHDVEADKSTYAPGESITWRFVCEGAESITYEISNSQGAVVQSGAPEEGNKVHFKTDDCDTYTLTLTATAGEATLSETSTISVVAVEEEPPALALTVEVNKTEYAPGEAVIWRFVCEGADSLTYEISNSQGTVVQSGNPEEGNEISFQTEECDTYTLTLTAKAGEETLTKTSTISIIKVETLSLILTVAKTEYVPGEAVIWRFVCEGAESLTYEISNSQGTVVQSGNPEEENEISFQTEECDTYTLTLTAKAGEETLTESSTISVVKEELALTLNAEKTVYAPGEAVTWQFACKGADSLTYEICNTKGEVVQSGTPEEGNEISFQTDVCDAYTLTLTATAGEETLTETSTIYVTSGDVAISMATDLRYAVANESSIDFQAEILGGVAPYTVALQAVAEGVVVYEENTEAQEPGVLPLSIMPTVFGVHTITVTVTDAAGTTAQAILEMPVAIREPESEEDWNASVSGASLTGDWRGDLAAVARTQLGYQESDRDFIIDEEGALRGYTRYGAWNGDPYGEWSAAFVSFCLSYANIPSSSFPRSADCASWKSTLSGMGLYQEEGYTPAQGDLIFFNWSGSSTPECVGIVDDVSADTVFAIVGIAGQGVSRNSYSLGDACITGYASMEASMRNAGLLKEEVKTGPITLEARWEGETLGVGDMVTLTALDTDGAPVLWQCLMQEDGEWQLAQEGGETFTFEVTQENCVWSWRAVYASDVANAENAEGTQGAENAEAAEDTQTAENTENTEDTVNAENAEGDKQ